MQSLNIEEPFAGKYALFELGFRPFFLLAGLSALVLVMSWVGVYLGLPTYASYYGPLMWHGHEMIFGYAVAVIAGFLLTAVGNWTGQKMPKNKPLIVLVVLWCLGRVLPFGYEFVPVWLIAGVDIVFLPCVGVVIGRAILKSKNKRNLFFIPVFSLFTVANVLMHLDAQAGFEGVGKIGERMALGIVVLIVGVIGGRVIPFFTQAGLRGFKATMSDNVNKLSIVAVAMFAVLYAFFGQQNMVVGVAALVTAGIHSVKLKGWYTPRIWGEPLLWVLHLSYVWFIVGLVLLGVESFMPLLGKPGLHALTVGLIGGITLGMMSRVSLGHTGRPLQIVTAIKLAFALINIATLLRVFVPLVSPDFYQFAVTMSGILWCIAFVLFLLVYMPVLIYPRVDGRPG